MWEFLSGVDTINEAGTEATWNSVMRLHLRLKFQNPDDSVTLSINGKAMTIKPDSIPAGFSVVNTAPELVVEGEIAGQTIGITCKGNASFEAFGYYVKDGDAFKKDLMTYFGNDEIVKAIGALQATINNLQNEPVIVDLGRW